MLALAACSPAGDRAPAPVSPGPATAAPSGRQDPATDPAYAEFYGQRPAWKRCGGDGFQCTTIIVPVNWAAPDGPTLKLAVSRKRAAGAKIGSLLYNPGGPGASGLEYAPAVIDQLGRGVRRAYDFVSWDPRGVGESEPAVTCLPDAQLDAFYAADATPDTPQEQGSLISDVERYAKACAQNTGGQVLAHLDTPSTVRDMDVIRGVLGEPTLSFLGASYGTYLGAWYAETFPWRVGRMVLDGAVDPSEDAAKYYEAQARGFSRALESYIDHCLRSSGCPLRGSRKTAMDQLQQLSARIDAQPLGTDSDRRLTQALFLTGLMGAMYSPDLWRTATQGLTEALDGDGSTMLLLADSYLRRNPDGTYGQLLQVTSAIYCLDHGDRRTVEQISTDASRLKAAYPPFGDVLGWGAVTCAEWPLDGVTPAKRLTAAGAAPILVVGTTNDPATPYESAQSLASQLSSGRLLTFEGDGHAAYGNGNPCLDKTVDAYLVDGTLPAEGTRCR